MRGRSSTGARTALLAAVAVATLSLVYLGLMLAWVAIQEPLDSPGFELRGPLRQFFGASVVVAVIAGVTGFVPLLRICRVRPGLRAFVMAGGFLMVATGLIGMLFVIPEGSDLSGAGGLTPNFGHLLTYENFTGALWLFLLTGAIPYAAGYFAVPRFGYLPATTGMLIAAAAPLWYIAYALYERWQHITAP